MGTFVSEGLPVSHVVRPVGCYLLFLFCWMFLLEYVVPESPHHYIYLTPPGFDCFGIRLSCGILNPPLQFVESCTGHCFQPSIFWRPFCGGSATLSASGEGHDGSSRSSRSSIKGVWFCSL